jgi:hypothetical protein
MVHTPSLAEALPSFINVKCPACGSRVTTRQSGNTTRCAVASGGCGTAFYVPAGFTRPLVGVTCRACCRAWSTRAAAGSTIRCPACSHSCRVPVNIRAAQPARPQRAGSTSSSSRSTTSRSTSSRSTGTGSTSSSSRSTSSSSRSTGTGSTSSSSRSTGSRSTRARARRAPARARQAPTPAPSRQSTTALAGSRRAPSRQAQAPAPKMTKAQAASLLAQIVAARQGLKTAPAAARAARAARAAAPVLLGATAPKVSRRATAGLGGPRVSGQAIEPTNPHGTGGFTVGPRRIPGGSRHTRG